MFELLEFDSFESFDLVDEELFPELIYILSLSTSEYYEFLMITMRLILPFSKIKLKLFSRERIVFLLLIGCIVLISSLPPHLKHFP
jgi:hypothetical protein